MTSDDAGHDAVADSGALTTDTQGAVALALARVSSFTTSLTSLDANLYLEEASALLDDRADDDAVALVFVDDRRDARGLQRRVVDVEQPHPVRVGLLRGVRAGLAGRVD